MQAKSFLGTLVKCIELGLDTEFGFLVDGSLPLPLSKDSNLFTCLCALLATEEYVTNKWGRNGPHLSATSARADCMNLQDGE